MILFNICGSPGSGKTVTSHELFLAFKKAHYHVELTGEVARDYMYTKNLQCLGDNPFLVCAQQWERIFRLHRFGVDVAVCDSPVIQACLYMKGSPFYSELKTLLQRVHREFQVYNVLVHRAHPYRAAERLQTEEEAAAFLPEIRELFDNQFWMEIKGNDEENRQLIVAALKLADERLHAGVCVK